MSVAVVQRQTIDKLIAWDAVACSHAEVAPGAAIFNYKIHRHSLAEIEGGAEPYAVRFESNGREYWCGLPAFQARTRMLPQDSAADAMAV